MSNWMKKADIEDGNRPGLTVKEAEQVRELKKRNRLLEQENEVLRRAAAYLLQGPGAVESGVLQVAEGACVATELG